MNTDTAQLPTAAAAPTVAKIIDKFNELRAKYYTTSGYMISTIPDSISEHFIDSNPESIWTQRYNHYVSDKFPILYTMTVVEVFGRKFKVRFDRPYKPEHRSEFETYFGFGGHCCGYTNRRVIACFPSCQPDDNDLDAAEILAAAAADTSAVDNEYVKRVLALLVLGGYVKCWDAYYELSAWFASFNLFPEANAKFKDVILPYIFEHAVPACHECGLSESQFQIDAPGEQNLITHHQDGLNARLCDKCYKQSEPTE